MSLFSTQAHIKIFDLVDIYTYTHTHKYTTLSFPHFPWEPNCWSTLTICKNNKQRKVCLFNTMFRANRCYSYHQIPRLLIFPQFLPSLKYPSYTSISEPNLPKFKSIAPSTNSGVNNLYTSIAGVTLARDRVLQKPSCQIKISKCIAYPSSS